MPDALHRRGRYASVPTHLAHAPVRGVVRLALANLVHNELNLLVAHTARAASARGIGQTRQTIRPVAPPPLGDSLHRRAQALGNHGA